jgi:hypothetical protein
MKLWGFDMYTSSKKDSAVGLLGLAIACVGLADVALAAGVVAAPGKRPRNEDGLSASAG